MSWIVGLLSKALSPEVAARLARLHPEPLHRSMAGGLYVAAGGLAETCRAGVLPGPEGGGWIVAGSALVQDGAAGRLLDGAAWSSRLADAAPDLARLDGHFAGVRWRGGTLTAFTDALGLRSLYLARTPHGLVFSTRLDWVCRFAGRHDVDPVPFGAHWLAFNQLSGRSLVAGVERLAQGGTAVCTASDLSVRHVPWEPGRGDGGDPGPLRRLEPFLHPRLDPPLRLSLGLSGGLDSRLLLALLIDVSDPFQLHVFGPSADPDVHVSRLIAREQRLPQAHLATTVPPASACLRLLADYAGQTCASTPASAVVKLSSYGVLHAQQRVVVDGGFGEIARRQFFNRLLRRGARTLRAMRPEALLPYVRVARADVFEPGLAARLERGFAEEAALLFDTMPRPTDLGLANFLDLAAIRTRLPNFYGYGQPRLDEQVVNYMPFAQPSFLRSVLAAPLAEREEGRLFRRTIRARVPVLTAYPLVKGGTTYAFGLPTVPAWLWTKVKARLGTPYRDHTSRLFLHALSGYVRELVRSEETRSYGGYDPARLQALVDRYYAGDAALRPAVDWWLSFEAWRRSLAGKPIA